MTVEICTRFKNKEFWRREFERRYSVELNTRSWGDGTETSAGVEKVNYNANGDDKSDCDVKFLSEIWSNLSRSRLYQKTMSDIL